MAAGWHLCRGDDLLACQHLQDAIPCFRADLSSGSQDAHRSRSGTAGMCSICQQRVHLLPLGLWQRIQVLLGQSRGEPLATMRAARGPTGTAGQMLHLPHPAPKRSSQGHQAGNTRSKLAICAALVHMWTQAGSPAHQLLQAESLRWAATQRGRLLQPGTALHQQTMTAALKAGAMSPTGTAARLQHQACDHACHAL